MATELAKAYVQIVPSAQGISGSISDVLSGESKSAGEKSGAGLAGSLGKTLKSSLVKLGVGKLLMDSIGNTSEFETGMAKVNTLFKGTDAEFQKLSADILTLSGTYGLGATTLSEAAYSAESAGVPMEDLTAMLESSAKLATAGFTDIDTALSATAKTMNAYGISGEESMDRVSKVLMQTQNLGITTVGELGASLANVTPTAAAMGVEFEQVGAAMAQMTAAGVPTAQATTQLRAAMTELGKEGTKADKAFRAAAKNTEYAGMSFQEAMSAGADLGDVFGLMQAYADKSNKSMVDLWGSVEAGNAAMLIAGDVETFNTNMEQMATDADVVGDAYGKMANTLGKSFNRLKESSKNFVTALFTGGDISASFDSMLSSMGDISTKLIGWLTNGLQNLGQNFPQLIGKLFDFGAGLFESLANVDWIGVGVSLINGIIGAAGTLGSKLVELLGNAVSAVCNGDVDFGQIGTALINGVKSILGTTGGWLKSIFITAKNAVKKINFGQIGTAIMNGVKSVIDAAGNFLKSLFTSGRDASKGEGMNYESIGTAILDGIKSVLDTAGNFLGNLFQSGMEAAKNQPWPSVGEFIKTALNIALNGGQFLAAAFEGGAELIRSINWTEVGRSVGDLLVSGLNVASALVENIGNAASSILTSINWSELGSSAGNLIVTGLNAASNLVSTLSNAAAELLTGIDWSAIGQGASELVSAGFSTAANLVTVFGNAAGNLISGVDWGSVGKSAGELVVSGFKGVTTLMNDAFTAVHDFMAGIDWSDVGAKVQQGLGSVWEGLTGLVGGTLSGAGETLKGAGRFAGKGLSSLADLLFGDDMSEMRSAVEDLKKSMNNLNSALETGKALVQATASSVGSTIRTSISTEVAPAKMFQIGSSMITGIQMGIAMMIVPLATTITGLTADIKKSFEGGEGYWKTPGEKMISGITTGMGNKAEELTTKATALIELAKAAVQKVSWTSCGSDIVSGIIAGINMASARLFAVMQLLGLMAMAALKKTLLIGSPSRVMRDQIGRWIPAGIAEGITGYAGVVSEAMDDLAYGMTSGRVRTTLSRQNAAGTGGIGNGFGMLAQSMDDAAAADADNFATQNALLREQNRLLQRILDNGSGRPGASASFGRTVKQSLAMYEAMGG